MNSDPPIYTRNYKTDELEKINPLPIMNDCPMEKFSAPFDKSKSDVNNGKVSSVDSGVETGNDSNDSIITQIHPWDQFKKDWFGSDSKPNENNQIALVRTQSLPTNASSIQSASTNSNADDIDQPQSSLSSDDKARTARQLRAIIHSLMTIYPDSSVNRSADKCQEEVRFIGGKSIKFSPSSDSFDLEELRSIGGKSIKFCPSSDSFDLVGPHRRLNAPAGHRGLRVGQVGKYSPLGNNFLTARLQRRMRLAAATNNVALVKNLLDRGISPNNSDEQGRTPLHFAAGRGYTEVVDLLLKHGAKANSKDTIGNTPLHLAAVTSKVGVVGLLLEAEVDPLSPDYHGYSPLQLAKSNLRFVQKSCGGDVDGVKSEVHAVKVVKMLTAFLKKRQGFGDQIEALSSSCSRLTLCNTSDEVNNEVQNLLANIDNIQLNS